MQRDGSCISIWQNTTDEFQSLSKNNPDQLIDVLIVGGGITGVATALQLQKSGLQCTIAEAKTLCFGTSGGTTAHINTFYDTSYDIISKKFGEDDAQLAARAAMQSVNLFSKLVEEYQIDCGFSTKQGYLYSQNEQQTKHLDEIYLASKKAGVAVDYINEIPVPIEFQKALVFHNQAEIHPSRYVIALANEFIKLGGIILQNCPLFSFKEKNEIIEAETAQGMIQARHLIFATHIPPGINLLHFRCAPYRSYAIAVTLKDENYPDALAYDMRDPYNYYRSQEIDGKKFLIAGGFDHKTAHEPNTIKCFRELELHVKSHFHVDKIEYSWSSQYYEPSDGLAYIGLLPGHSKNVYVATGFGGNGITYSHISAQLLTDLILKGSSEFADLFDPSRIKMVAGFANFVKENADVVSQFIGKRLTKEKISGLSEMAKDEAKVVRYESESIALYKDENGGIHAINPVCTHAKCIVAWNTAEKSWDCPCHGARYNADGEMITGPASKGLEKVEWINEHRESNNA